MYLQNLAKVPILFPCSPRKGHEEGNDRLFCCLEEIRVLKSLKK